MSGPYCKTCDFYRPLPLGEPHGECLDYSKRIMARSGDYVNDKPEVLPHYSCKNWTPMREADKALDDQVDAYEAGRRAEREALLAEISEMFEDKNMPVELFKMIQGLNQ